MAHNLLKILPGSPQPEWGTWNRHLKTVQGSRGLFSPENMNNEPAGWETRLSYFWGQNWKLLKVMERGTTLLNSKERNFSKELWKWALQLLLSYSGWGRQESWWEWDGVGWAGVRDSGGIWGRRHRKSVNQKGLQCSIILFQPFRGLPTVFFKGN